jgi:hypothetical protein
MPCWCTLVLMARIASQTGLETRENERERLLQLVRRFKEIPDSRESDRLLEELAQLVFGE